MILGALLGCEDDLGIIITSSGMHEGEFSKYTFSTLILIILYSFMLNFFDFGVTSTSMGSIWE